MPSLKFKNRAEFHEIQRLKICLICMKKKDNMIEIKKGSLKEKIEKLVSYYNASDERFPKVVCSACKILVYISIKKNESKLKLPELSKFNYIKHLTRQTEHEKKDANVIYAN